MTDTVISRCGGCDTMFRYNPVHVPRLTLRKKHLPICKICIATINSMRQRHGMKCYEVSADAYDDDANFVKAARLFVMLRSEPK